MIHTLATCKKIALSIMLICLASTSAFGATKNSLFVAGKPTIICFGGSYCPACRRALPALKSVQKKYTSRATIRYLDVMSDRQIASEFPLQVVPTYFFYDKNGKTYSPSISVKEQIEFNLAKSKKSKTDTWLLHVGGLSEDELEVILTDLGVK